MPTQPVDGYDRLSYYPDSLSYRRTHRSTDPLERPSLTNAELAVMELLWEHERLTARQIQENVYPHATKAQHGTVQKLLQRLEEKQVVARDRTLPVHLFSAQLSREAYASGQLESLADKLTGGSLAPLITHLMQEKRISRAEIERLRDVLGVGRTGRRK